MTEPDLRRILMTGSSASGLWTYTLELAGGLSAAEIEVHLAILDTPLSGSQREQAQEVPLLFVHESPRPISEMDGPWSDALGSADWLLGLDREVRPDLIHLNSYAYAAWPWSAPVLVVGHSCVFSWFDAVKRAAPPIEWEGYRRNIVRGLRAADGVVAPSMAMLRSLGWHYGQYRSLGYIHHGRDSRRFAPSRKEPFILTAGHIWDDAKNVATLERIAPQLPWPVFIAGDVASALGGEVNTGSTRRLGQLSPKETAGWMSRASIFCLPARYEPFGWTALEAALSGCALVLGDIPSLREIWNDAAVLVSPDDPAELLSTLQWLIGDDKERTAVAERARARALEFSPQRMTEGYVHAYRELVRRSPRPAARASETADSG